ncbi:two-component system chemotaxis response regulator CheV [Alkalihalobacillus xiaoxiensis]|uniref:Two-component system chemotaxis response regulator CheV n=1 Tax=Shouchella xiaoxiensis TaxID=766895 RepID=A0ABS2SZ28_9BACI|nr:chemotaxis protein CheV [Shouchella xiaoxiensis]MBM7840778.1 two-component system chemotaxis response regulator CheV [Shouchella xiaoxiensis]
MALALFQSEQQEYDQELILFRLNEQQYALNVLKVKEIIRPVEVHASPNRHKMVEGMIRVRDTAIPLLNTYELLQLDAEENKYFIIVEFAERQFALRVGDVSSIKRIHTKQITPPDDVSKGKEKFLSGIVTISAEEMAFILDLEKAVHYIHPLHFSIDFKENYRVERETMSLLLLEDSQTMRLLLTEALADAGYKDVLVFNNGKDANDYTANMEDEDVFDAVITDIDLPHRNGFEFTKRLRQLPLFQDVPVFSFSSLHPSVVERKGKEAGVTSHVVKPDIEKLIAVLDQHLLK